VLAPALVEVPAEVDALFVSPGLPPTHRLVRDASRRAIPVLGELELAWRLRGDRPARWLMVTGTNGKTTTTRMLEAVLVNAGRRALAVGNVGVSVIDAVMADDRYETLAVEASSFQLQFAHSLRPLAGVVLNLAEDHLDWHGSMEAYARAKARVWDGDGVVANADDPAVMSLLSAAARTPSALFTVDHPQAGRWRVEDLTALAPDDTPILPLAQIHPAGAHNVANALAAMALAAADGVGALAMRDGLIAFEADAHRNQLIDTIAGVSYVDDSKATNPHAAAGSLAAYPSVVWIAGGQLKGASIDNLVERFAGKLRGAVLLGEDRHLIAASMARHAPDVPVIDIASTDDGVMIDVARAALSLAKPGDVVLLAPAGASKDMFSGYDQRGDLFQRAVSELGRRAGLT
jgi:UDP-N-acetylmuramoylalanine--D-glutamate ligase